VSFEVVWEPAAVDLCSRFLSGDPDGLHAVFEAVDTLAERPRPDEAFPLGSSVLYRLGAGRYRVVYEIDDLAEMVKIRHVGRRT
jgi:mRNA interferase RelE/StbE